MDLDELLADSAPAPARRTAAVEHALDVLVTETEQVVRQPRRRRRAGVIAAGVVATVGLGTAGAVAAGLVPTPISWSTGSGRACEMEFYVQARGTDGEPPKVDYTPAQQARAAADAKQFLAGFDYHSIDQAAAIAQWQRAEDAVIASEPLGDKQARLKGDDLAITAVGDVVWQRVAAHLRAGGFTRPQDAISWGQGWRCE